MTECCEPKRGAGKICPECGKPGKPVQWMTLENLLNEPSKIAGGPYRFCATADCPVVYFRGQVLAEEGEGPDPCPFHKDDLKVRVGIKEKEDPVPLCYCFGWDRLKIWGEIKRTGKSTAVESITKKVKAGECFCERSNPQGTCCLGNISKAVKEAVERLGKGS
ncbi:MAG: copper chaperone Copz family protein [Candidatus Omnitrophica bacterium]|nr:copper chaperone Copz family protein [Candidatus Omnitrophota bacterium]